MKGTVVKVNKTESYFFEELNEIETPLAILIKKKREKSQISS